MAQVLVLVFTMLTLVINFLAMNYIVFQYGALAIGLVKRPLLEVTFASVSGHSFLLWLACWVLYKMRLLYILEHQLQEIR